MKSQGYHISEIAKIVNAKSLQFTRDDLIYELASDSRQSLNPNYIFIAISSSRNDGHKYLEQAYLKGVRNFMLSRDVSTQNFPEANFLLVENCLSSLQTLTAYHRQQFEIPLIGITGSNGKTSVKEWLYQLLHNDYNIVRSPKSFNSQIGVPLSVWKMNDDDEIGIFEAGISQKDEMEKLQKIIQPTIGIITNIGDAHSQNFSSKKETVREKLKLFKESETLIYCRDYLEIDEMVKELVKPNKFSWSFSKEARLRIHSVEKAERKTRILGEIDQQQVEFEIAFMDQASIENSINCWLCLYVLGYSAEAASSKMPLLQQLAMRLELKEGINDSTLINDSYNSDLDSLKIALQVLSQQFQHSKKSLILSDLVQIKTAKKKLYQAVVNLVKENGIQRFVGIGEDIMLHRELFDEGSSFYLSTKDFLHEFNLTSISNEAILIKGARKFEFEKITELLQQKSHETMLEINLSAMIDNLNFFRSKLNKDTKLMAMVKAFSYGSGSFEIANVLQYHHVDYLSVAYADEGVALRKAGISIPIMVMNPETESYESMIRNKLEPEIYSLRVLELFKKSLKANQYFLSDEEAYPIHIKLDTGMHRLGFMEDEIASLIKELKKSNEVKAVSIFSHLSSAEDEQEDDYTLLQIEKFEKMSNSLIDSLQEKPIIHLLNSNGMLRFPKQAYDMVRLGIGLYGIVSLKDFQNKLKPISVLKTAVSQIKKLSKGDSVGYSRKGFMTSDGRIATIPVGYADGISRSLGSGNWHVQIGKHLFPTIGNICMDMCMINIGDADIKEGEEVIVFGGKKSIYELSEAMQKSPYELLTGISSRVKRIYYYE